MSNSATATYNSNFQIYEVKVNEKMVFGTDNSTQANTIRDRLNRIFADPNRDLDFITPSYANGSYVVCCPKVRSNVNEITYLYDTSNGSNGWRHYKEKLYEPTNWADSTSASGQTSILTISNSTTAPWYNALHTANLIRSAIKLNFNDALGRSTCRQLEVPSNTKATVARVISNSARCDVYGIPCQGTEPGKTSACSELGWRAQNISNTYTWIDTEVFHPQDLTAAMTSTNNWHSTYKNKFVKVTNLSNTSKSIIVKVTDKAPAGKGIELSYRAWVEIGRPLDNNSVKIELMG
ncbi:RlpA-like double-psi beta-barrel domain-containing protein [Alkaliphilus peptidifermentans]|uniref:Uncharacterized protein n=1 Tax=Alkaliphilus peptidifermentans DSM 18978 TaxID=1120976 RepID=A0A1G5JMJ4_9FIRM|nr:septal ring lytic transglycosylase RlpA family protein [Alkaliphilus peptidifermentans]SCY89526.1 hypothetical protein SAMN03080606_02934 [Alkaliphilus peptidifermentans DSM 18978]